jgi:N-terminal domain of M60-like peptidases/Peptidase M60, enhancin and enhancin-like/Concanavalin A-like lectin/glucanases superfamily
MQYFSSVSLKSFRFQATSVVIGGLLMAASSVTYAQNAPLAGYRLCAMERHQCAFNGSASVVYGINDTWTTPRTFKNGVSCENAVFGDPAYKKNKFCYFQPVSTPTPDPTIDIPPFGFKSCTTEGQRCNFTGAAQVVYGAKTTWTTAKTFNGGVICNNATFGDPLAGVLKRCYSKPVVATDPQPLPDAPPGGFTLCSSETQRCNFTGTSQVVYGARTTWTTPKTFAGGVMCDNATFGDPMGGVVKRCYSKTAAAQPPVDPLACPAALVLPATSACDGVSLTDGDAVAFRSAGIKSTAGPAGAVAYRVDDDQYIDVRDTACTRLGQTGTDFSISMWLKLSPGSSHIIGSTDPYSYKPGFMLYSSPRSDGQIELRLHAGELPSLAADGFKSNVTVISAPFKPNEWVHVALVYDSNGPRKSASFTLWLNMEPFLGEGPIDVYLPRLRIGDQGWGVSASMDVSEVRSYKRALTESELKALVLQKSAVVGLSGSELKLALDRLRAHVDGTTALAPAALEAELARLQQHARLMDTDLASTRRALDLVAAYESKAGPLFISAATRDGIKSKPAQSDPQHPSLIMAKVHQLVLDQVYTQRNVQSCSAELSGKPWGTSSYFPGSVAAAPNLELEHRPLINASVSEVWGQPVAYDTVHAVRPTGLYLAPGGVAEVTVPDAMVGSGFELQVGAHVHDLSDKTVWNRLPRVSKRYPINARVTRIANPLGGGVYVLVPYLADLGVQTVTVKGAVVEAPFFSARRFDKTTDAQWRSRRTAPAPWADFESEKFMMQVPSSWIYAFEGPTALMQKWDTAMDGYSELVGYPPEKRNRTVMYQHVDTNIRFNGGYGIGYPFGNTIYNPREKGNGNVDHWFLRDPIADNIEYHELGHAQMMSYFNGEGEAIVNFPYTYIANVKFGVDFDKAFVDSFAKSYGGKGLTPDEAAIDWMITPNFRRGAPMDISNSTKNEMRYQFRGYAKYADVARTFGWEAIRSFYRQENLDFMARKPSNGLDQTDSRILDMSVAANSDLTPLIHFWGVHPVNAGALKNAIRAKGLVPSPKVRALLERYMTLIPKNNAAFNAIYRARHPSGCTAPSNPDYGCGWFEQWTSRYSEAEAAQAQATLRNLIQFYFP